MQNVKNLNLLNRRPTLVISHEGLEAIKHIVSIAPQEAQWFHTVEPIQYQDTPDEIFLELSTKLYIPKQHTSAAQVDSTSNMMIEFYNELKQEYQDQVTVNQKLSTMTCWCHSHHTMSPNPSNQDDLQFNSFINLAEDQSSNTWQVMLIFNKKDQFYSRVWDPSTGLIYEGVDIIVDNCYDFSYIDKAAKEKFIKKTFSFPKQKKVNHNASWLNFYGSTPYQPTSSVENLFLNEEVALECFKDIFDVKTKADLLKLPKVQFTKTLIDAFYNAFYTRFEEKEISWFIYLASNNLNLVLKTFTDYGFTKYGHTQASQYACFTNLFTDEILPYDLFNSCVTALDVSDCNTKKEAELLLTQDSPYTKLTK